jgi:methylphosphonate synthase
MAAALHIRSADLMADLFDKNEEVVVSYIRDNPSRPYPDSNRPICRLTELARVHHQPGLKGFEITVVDRDTGPGGEFRHGLHQYVYNYGNNPVNLQWGKALQDMLAPGDSAYLQPMTRHSFSLPAGIGEGHLVAVRVPGVLTDKVLDEYGSYSKEGRGRAVGEDRTWF